MLIAYVMLAVVADQPLGPWDREGGASWLQPSQAKSEDGCNSAAYSTVLQRFQRGIDVSNDPSEIAAYCQVRFAPECAKPKPKDRSLCAVLLATHVALNKHEWRSSFLTWAPVGARKRYPTWAK